MRAPVRVSPIHRTVGIDLAIRGLQVAQVFDDGQAVGKPIRLRLTAMDLTRVVALIKQHVAIDTPITAVMEPTGMAWFPVAAWLQHAESRSFA